MIGRPIMGTRLLVSTAMLVSLTVSETEVIASSNKELPKSEACQYEEFSGRREDCNRNYNFLSSRADSGCHILQLYVDCISMALRTTSCTSNPFFLGSESNVVLKKMKDKNLTCDLHSETIVIEIRDHRKGCLRVRAVKLFFQCGTAFHFHTEGQSLSHETFCKLLKTYKNCGMTALKETNCIEDENLTARMSYFLEASMLKHSASCPDMAKQRMPPWMSKVYMMPQSKECQMEEALRRYFTCGSNFLWKMVIWKRHYAKHKDSYGLPDNGVTPNKNSLKATATQKDETDEICAVAKEFRECTSEITSGRECPNLSGLSEKMMTMQDMLVGESVKVECRMLSRNNDAVYPSYSKQNLPPPGCSYRKLVKLFSYCTVNFFSSFALAKDAVQACMFLGRHGSCVELARKATGCNMRVKELEDFVYLTRTVQDKYASMCKGQEKNKLAEKKDMAGVPSLCKKKTLLREYFKCSHLFQNRLATKKDECRSLSAFTRCFMEIRADTECTYTDDNFISMLQMQTELMTDNIRSRCSQESADLNVLLKCSQAEALKKMLLCGLSYNKLMEDLKREGEFYVTATTCSYLAEYQHCMIEVERSTGCTKSELHQHTSAVLSFWTWNIAPLCESAASLLLNDADPRCDHPKTLLRTLKCGMEFQEYAEQTTWEAMTAAQSCSSLQTLDSCLMKSLEVRQCKHSLNAKAQVSVLKSLLMSEYKISCKNVYQSAPGLPGIHSDEYPLDDYYFGDEVALTRAPMSKIEGLSGGGVDKRRRVIAAPRARSQLIDESVQKLLRRVEGLEVGNILNQVQLELPTTTGSETTGSTARDNTITREDVSSRRPPVLMVPVAKNSYAPCGTAIYKKEREGCELYMTNQVKKYQENLKNVPISNFKDSVDNVCKMVDIFRACLTDVAERHRCPVMLSDIPKMVDEEITQAGLAFCTSTAVESRSPSLHCSQGLILALLLRYFLKFKTVQ